MGHCPASGRSGRFTRQHRDGGRRGTATMVLGPATRPRLSRWPHRWVRCIPADRNGSGREGHLDVLSGAQRRVRPLDRNASWHDAQLPAVVDRRNAAFGQSIRSDVCRSCDAASHSGPARLRRRSRAHAARLDSQPRSAAIGLGQCATCSAPCSLDMPRPCGPRSRSTKSVSSNRSRSAAQIRHRAMTVIAQPTGRRRGSPAMIVSRE